MTKRQARRIRRAVNMAFQDFSDAVGSGNYIETLEMLVAIRSWDSTQLTRRAYMRTLSGLVHVWLWPFTQAWPDEFLKPRLRKERLEEAWRG